jgi:3-deoxy-D-manno-octulosonic acid kinase
MSALPDLPPLPAQYVLAHGERSACARHREWLELLEREGYGPDSEPATRASTLAGRRPLEELETPRGTLLLRRFSHGGLLRALTGSRFGDPARPFHELALSAALHTRGIETPLVVGARARSAQGGGWLLDVLSLRVSGARDLESLLEGLRHGATRPADFAATARGAGAFVRRLHEAGLYHVDLTTKNLLVIDSSRFVVVDLDRSQLVEDLPASSRERNLRRLLRFVLRREERGTRALSARDYLRFLAGYEPRPARRRELARAVLDAHSRHLRWHRIGWGIERLLGLRRGP